MKFVNILLSAVWVAVWAAWGGAQTTDGVGSAAFLRRGVDARALGMGGAFVAVADGYSALYWNPAGLARTPSWEVGGMTANLYSIDIFFNFVAGRLTWDWAQPAAGPVENPTIAPVEEAEEEQDGAPTEGSDELEPQAPMPEAPQPEPAEPVGPELQPVSTGFRLAVGFSWTEMATDVFAFDEFGNPLGLIRYTEALYGVGVAAWLPRLGYLGGVVKVYSYRAPQAGVGGADATAFGIGFDLGLAAPVWGDRLWLGLAAADVGDTRVQWRNTPTEPTDRVAARYTLGMALFAPDWLWAGDRLVVAADGAWEPLLSTWSVRGGVEYSAFFLSLRAGVVWRDKVGLSFTAGAGVRALGLTLDGAWVQNRELAVEGAGHTLVLSVLFRF